MPDLETEALMEAHAAFYRAIRHADLAAMDALWSRRRRVSCTHPNGPSLFGREAVMESWRMILAQPRPPQLHATEPQPIVAGRTAMILCREALGQLQLIASNVFVHERTGWRMVNHQAAIVPAEAG